MHISNGREFSYLIKSVENKKNCVCLLHNWYVGSSLTFFNKYLEQNLKCKSFLCVLEINCILGNICMTISAALYSTRGISRVSRACEAVTYEVILVVLLHSLSRASPGPGLMRHHCHVRHVRTACHLHPLFFFYYEIF